MRHLTFYASLLAIGLTVGKPAPIKAQDTSSTITVSERSIFQEVCIGKKEYERNGEEVRYPRTYGGLTFSRIDWGFSRLLDNGSFTLGLESQFLEYKKASNFGFDVAQFGVRFNPQFKVYVSAGFEWNYLRLKHNVLLDQDATPLDYSNPTEVTYKKNVFTSTYLRIPLTIELRTKKLANGERIKFAFGPMTGILLKGTQRLKSNELGKQKFKDNYNLATFQYGGFARIGYNDFGFFAKYYANDMFEKSPVQEGINNLTFGLTLGF